MEHYDLLIVGGGPAGSTLAWALRDSGLNLRILDKQAFPRDKTCAGWVTPAVLESLKVDPDDYAQGRELQPIRGFRIGLMNQPALENDYGGRVVSYGIRRCEFDDYLLKRSGAPVTEGVTIEAIRREGGRWILNDQYSADLLVGAGGHFCPVARHLGAKLGQSEQVVAAKEVEFLMTPDQCARTKVRETVPELYFCEDLKGYAWVFRKGNYLNIGLGREDNHRLSEHLQRFVDSLARDGRIPQDLPRKFKGHAYILYDHGRRRLVGDQVLLIGDAAGLAYTQSGEGIRPAVESALLAADCILQVRRGYSGSPAQAFSEVNLQRYAHAIQERFGKREQERLLKLDVPVLIKRPLARLLMRTHWFTREFVTNRWFLHSHVPALALA